MDELTRKNVGDITTRSVITIDAEETMEKAGKLMEEKQVTMLVITEKGQIAGILTAGDWFNSFYLHVGCHLPRNKFRTERAYQGDLQREKSDIVKKRAEEFKKMKVCEIMSRHFRTISESASLIDAVHEMKATELRRLLVTDDKGKVIGVLGRTKTITALLNELTSG